MANKEWRTQKEDHLLVCALQQCVKSIIFTSIFIAPCSIFDIQ